MDQTADLAIVFSPSGMRIEWAYLRDGVDTGLTWDFTGTNAPSTCSDTPLCEAGYVNCGGECLDAATRCCPIDPTVGLQCGADQVCNSDSKTCTCKDTSAVSCLTSCLSSGQCCKSIPDTPSGGCSQPDTCPSDGSTCAAGTNCEAALAFAGYSTAQKAFPSTCKMPA